MTQNPRTVDLLTEAFDIRERRLFELKNAQGNKVVDLYFRPITRADRIAANAATTNSTDALAVSTRLLCQLAELENGTKAFALADAPKLQRELPEKVLNEIELFLFGMDNPQLGEAKND